MVSPGIGSTKYNEQIKKCLADAFLSGRLVAIEVPAGEQKAKQREAIIKPKGVASQSTPGTALRGVPLARLSPVKEDVPFKGITKPSTVLQK